MIPREQLERWKALADAATPGPWFLQETPGSYAYIARWVVHEGEKLRCEIDEDADLSFAAAAREAVPVLVAEVEEQAKEIERLRAALRHVLHDDHVPDCSAWKCTPPLPPSGGHECSCPQKWSRAALKENT